MSANRRNPYHKAALLIVACTRRTRSTHGVHTASCQPSNAILSAEFGLIATDHLDSLL